MNISALTLSTTLTKRKLIACQISNGPNFHLMYRLRDRYADSTIPK